MIQDAMDILKAPSYLKDGARDGREPGASDQASL
jgi:hypothetical protein